jgi:hypothetical protein
VEPVKIIMRYTDGRMVKGFTIDFFPNKAMFHFRSVDSAPTDKGIEVSMQELKAIFFVKDFVGNVAYTEKKSFPEGQRLAGRKVEVTFTDGEVLVGSTLSYDPARLGFFVTPADPQSNNLRVFVLRGAINNVSYL